MPVLVLVQVCISHHHTPSHHTNTNITVHTHSLISQANNNTYFTAQHGMVGGFLFEYWLVIQANETVFNVLEKTVGNEWQLEQKCLDKCIHKWYFWMLKYTHDINQKYTQQLLYVSLALQYKGLSNSGLNLLGKGGVVLGKQSFNNLMEKISRQESQVTVVKLKEPLFI